MTTTENDLVEAMAETMLEHCGQGSSRHDAPSWLSASTSERLHWRDLARAGLAVVRAHDDEQMDGVQAMLADIETETNGLRHATHKFIEDGKRASAAGAIAARFAARCWAALDSAGRAAVDRSATAAERAQFGCLSAEGSGDGITEPALATDGGPAT